jgi:hypothetical protein
LLSSPLAARSSSLVSLAKVRFNAKFEAQSPLAQTQKIQKPEARTFEDSKAQDPHPPLPVFCTRRLRCFRFRRVCCCTALANTAGSIAILAALTVLAALAALRKFNSLPLRLK